MIARGGGKIKDVCYRMIDDMIDDMIGRTNRLSAFRSWE